MRRLATLLIALCLCVPRPADANPVCRWVGLCLYFSPGFEVTVVDAQTGKPLPGVYAWAEWVQYGAHGVGGPLVVQDAFSDADGRLKFPRWGPTRGSSAGLPLGRDPAIILFKSGYTTLLIQNRGGGSDHRAFIRGASHDGQTLKLEPFRGSDSEWVEQIYKLVYPGLHGYVSESQRLHFGPVYLRRTSRAIEAVGRLPASLQKASDLLWTLQRSAQFYRGEAR